MSVRPIVLLGDPRLRLKGKPVDSFGKYLHELLDDLAHTMRDAPGVGLAAPQLGEAMQACVIEVESQLYELVNPTIVRSTGDDRDLEGCLSIPGYVAYVTRRERVWVVAQNRHGKKIKVAGLRAARAGAPARARSPRRQALHRLPRFDGRAAGRSAPGTRTTPRSARRRAPWRDQPSEPAARRRGPSFSAAAGSAAEPSTPWRPTRTSISSAVVTAPPRPPGAVATSRRSTPIARRRRRARRRRVLTPERLRVAARSPRSWRSTRRSSCSPTTARSSRRRCSSCRMARSTCTRRSCRGIAARRPIPATILAGDRETGVTLMRMDDGPRHRARSSPRRACRSSGTRPRPSSRRAWQTVGAPTCWPTTSDRGSAASIPARPQPAEGASLTRAAASRGRPPRPGPARDRARAPGPRLPAVARLVHRDADRSDRRVGRPRPAERTRGSSRLVRPCRRRGARPRHGRRPSGARRGPAGRWAAHEWRRIPAGSPGPLAGVANGQGRVSG